MVKARLGAIDGRELQSRETILVDIGILKTEALGIGSVVGRFSDFVGFRQWLVVMREFGGLVAGTFSSIAETSSARVQ